MEIDIKWHSPIALEDGDDVNMIYFAEGVDEWLEVPAVYMFCRVFNDTLIPLYIGRSIDVGVRISQHLNTTRMMKEIEKSMTGKRVLVIGECIAKPGQKIASALQIAEKTLIEHALAEGYELINKAGTKTPVHKITFRGYQKAKNFSGNEMYAKKSKNANN